MMNDHLERWFGGNDQAVHFVTTLWDACQRWDDIVDGDQSPTDADDLFSWLTFAKEYHPFFRQHSDILRPALLMMYLNWQASHELESDSPSPADLDKSYVLRAGFYSVVHVITWIIGGNTHARKCGPEIWRSYGETRREIGEEFSERRQYDA